MKTSIYVCYHNKCNMFEDDIFKYIYCGAAINGEENYIPGTLRDDTGDNISHKNRTLCELTAMYWAWKNDENSDYIGFMHYRRHLNFSDNQSFPEDKYGVIYREYIDRKYIDDFSLNNTLQNIVSSYDIVLPKIFDVTNLGAINNFEQFKKSTNHNINDYIEACNLTKRKYPELRKYITEFNASNKCYFTNIFIMRRDLFLEYAHFLFNIVFNLEKILDFSLYNPQEARSIAFISERLFNIYTKYLLRKYDVKSIELQRTFVNHTYVLDTVKYIKSIPIVLAFDDNFVKFAASCVMSIVKNSNVANIYNIYIIHSNITDDNIYKFKENFKLKNFKIEFINCSHIFDKIKFNTHMHFSRETFFRIAIPELFVHYDKVIYIDADTIVLTDIANLYYIDIENYAIAGVKDYIMNGMYVQNIESNAETGGIPCREYVDNYLKTSITDYIQAGVLLFNIKKILQCNLHKKFYDLLENVYWFVDQDLLNVACSGQKKIIDMRWNVAHGNGVLDSFYKHIHYRDYYDFFSCIKNPYIIHYAGDNKPWDDPSLMHADMFWKYCRMTSYYEEVLFYSINRIVYHHFISVRNSFGKNILNFFLPIGTRRRALIKRLYLKFLKIKHLWRK